MSIPKIRIAIIGAGNCASSLLQGIYYYQNQSAESMTGLMHWDVGGYKPSDIEISAAFDIDRRKVGLDISEAIFAQPNCTAKFCADIPKTGVLVQMGKILDGYSDHMADYADEETFLLANQPEPSEEEVIRLLKESKTDILMNYLPVGSEKATYFYAECALKAGVAFINNIPVFIASDPAWARRFEEANIPLIGDDIKAQLGATITHRVLVDLFKKRGVKLQRTYQLNTGGNTDFLNMKNQNRLTSKRRSKTEAVQSVTRNRLSNRNIHVGPSDYVSWQDDNKVCFIRMEGELFGNVPMNLELRLSVEDSPNSAGVAIDAIRCAKMALDRGQGGVLDAPSAYFCKHPRNQFPDDQAFLMVNDFIQKTSDKEEAEVLG